MVQQQWLQLKTKFLVDYNMKIIIYSENEPLVGGTKIWWGESLLGGIFLGEGGGGWANFWLVGGESPTSPPVGKTLIWEIKTRPTIGRTALNGSPEGLANTLKGPGVEDIVNKNWKLIKWYRLEGQWQGLCSDSLLFFCFSSLLNYRNKYQTKV